VTHDRYLLDRVSTVVLVFDGSGAAERFADYSQWESWQVERKKSKPKSVATSAPIAKAAPAAAKKKLSYLDSREFSTIEGRIAEAERALAAARARLEDAQVARDPQRLADSYREIEQAQSVLDALYARWVELEEKIV
jgi:ATP-binding cassette subfamily F protein uup